MATAPERERVGNEVDVVPPGEGVEEPVGDFADPGRLAQERRAVDGEPQRRPQRIQISSGSCSIASRSRWYSPAISPNTARPSVDSISASGAARA